MKWIFLVQGIGLWLLSTIGSTVNLLTESDHKTLPYLVGGMVGVGLFIIINRLDQIEKK
jgi:hypothetical protein